MMGCYGFRFYNSARGKASAQLSVSFHPAAFLGAAASAMLLAATGSCCTFFLREQLAPPLVTGKIFLIILSLCLV